MPSAERFRAVMEKLKPARAARGLPAVMSTPDGDRLAAVMQSKSKLEITIDRKATPDFATFVLEQLPALYQEHRARDHRKSGD
jgi:ParB family chromosome partitioning protein